MGEQCYGCFREKLNEGPCPLCGYDAEEGAQKYPQALPAGSVLNGEYIVGRVLGQGGFGITYMAQSYTTKEIVAIKEYFPSHLAGRSSTRSLFAHSATTQEHFEYGKQRFLEEARTVAMFNDNPHIVDIYSFFEENKTAYFVMKYLDGAPLDKHIQSCGCGMSVQEAKDLLLPLMKAVAEVHRRGIVHRDIAPDNIILLPDGKACLIDFGAAKNHVGEKSKSMEMVVKEGFSPVEQYTNGEKKGPETDIYAMAASFYYAVSGRVPQESVQRMVNDQLPKLSELGVDIAPADESALMKALAVKAQDRYTSMDDFARDLGYAPPIPQPDPDPIPISGPGDLMGKATQALEEKNWQKAEAYLDAAQTIMPENPYVYLGKLLCELKVEKRAYLAHCKVRWEERENYKLAFRYADEDLRKELKILEGLRPDPGPKPAPWKKILIAAAAATAAVAALVLVLCLTLGSKTDGSERFGGGELGGWPTGSIASAADPELVLKIPALDLPAKDGEYNYKKLGAKLEPNQTYTLRIEGAKVTTGYTPGFGVRLYDFTESAKVKELDAELVAFREDVEEYSLVLKTPSSFGKDTDIIVYAGVQGKTKGVGLSYGDISLYKGEFAEDKIRASANPELVAMTTKMDIKEENKDYTYGRLNVDLEPNQTYTLYLKDIKVTAGQTAGVGVRIYDFTKGAAVQELDAALIDISDGAGGYRCILRTPESFGEDTDLLLYAGIHGKTKGVGVCYEGIRLYKGVYLD